MTTRLETRKAWCDIEATGLEKDLRHGAEIVEVYVRVTDEDLSTVAEFHSLVCGRAPRFVEAWIETWPDIIRKMHTDNGIVDELRAGKGRHSIEVENDLATFLARYNGGDRKRLYLAGNTIKFDWTFLERFMPLALDHVHYRTIDVTSTRLQLEGMFPDENWEYPKRRGHRAAADIDETIMEYRWLWEKAVAFFHQHNENTLPWPTVELPTK